MASAEHLLHEAQFAFNSITYGDSRANRRNAARASKLCRKIIRKYPGSMEEHEAHAILRNWLACGAPVVERTEERRGVTDPIGFTVPRCETDCVDLTWPAIYDGIITTRCATPGCHDSTVEEGELDLTGGAMAAYDRMVTDGEARGSQCDTPPCSKT